MFNPESQNIHTAGPSQSDNSKRAAIAAIDCDIRTATDLPADFLTAIKLLQQARALPETTKAERLFKHERESWIAKHVRQMQQGSPTIVLDANHHAQIEAAKKAMPTARAQRFDAIYLALEEKTIGLDAMPLVERAGEMVPDVFTAPVHFVSGANPILKRMASDAESLVRSYILNCLSELAKYEATYLENFALIYPETRSKEIHEALQNTTDPAEIQTLHAELQLVGGPGAKHTSQAVRTSVWKSYEEVKLSLRMLLRGALETAEQYREDAILGEQLFFAGHGLPREATGVSKQYDALINVLKSKLAHPVAQSSYGVPDPAESDLRTLFGVTVLPS